VSQAGFDGGLISGLVFWREEILRSHGPSEEVPR
jgi:hypothetical protein